MECRQVFSTNGPAVSTFTVEDDSSGSEKLTLAQSENRIPQRLDIQASDWHSTPPRAQIAVVTPAAAGESVRQGLR